MSVSNLRPNSEKSAGGAFDKSNFISTDDCRDFFSFLRNGIILCGLTIEGRCKVIDANPAALKIEGLLREAVIGMDFERVFPVVREFGILAAIQQVNRTGISLRIEPKRDSDAKGEIWKNVSITRLSSNVIAIVFNDFDESSGGSKDLQKSTLELGRLFANLPGIAFRCKNDRDWTMEVVSGGLADLAGYRPEEIIGNEKLSYADLILSEDREMVWKSIQESFTRDDHYEIEYRIVTKSGLVKHVLERGKVIRGTAEDEPFVEGFISDVTDLRVARREAEESKEKLEATFTSTINALSRIVEIRDPYTSGHQRKVGLLAASISRRMGLENRLCENIRISGLLHDIGKLWIPSEILSKPGRLNHIEFEMIKEHSRLGYEVLKEIEFDFPIADYVIQHHERLNGSGYPFGLKGEEILMPARIIAVADVVEAISSHRPYRPALGVEVAIEEITSGAGTLYDGSVTRACVGLLEDGFSFE
ncbi:HD domain-containing phosphohydrolase [Mesotoga sp.]|uniref:HD domain-containing phosphohydrolase n=3 Tax=Mesotoga sp. TaxID=2053577 RepID=UPI002633B2BA|nr:HD domain-containing phosphohydrolase [Mesotoga sp.]MDD3680461.1 HD domain-containing protein [Mesotoga sp.]MDD5683294.1 HD domain-containing protein [Mesotoga sp.]